MDNSPTLDKIENWQKLFTLQRGKLVENNSLCSDCCAKNLIIYFYNKVGEIMVCLTVHCYEGGCSLVRRRRGRGGHFSLGSHAPHSRSVIFKIFKVEGWGGTLPPYTPAKCKKGGKIRFQIAQKRISFIFTFFECWNEREAFYSEISRTQQFLSSFSSSPVLISFVCAKNLQILRRQAKKSGIRQT